MAQSINNATWNRVANADAFSKSPLTQTELTQYRDLVQKHPRGIYYITLATVEFRMGNFKEAIAAASKSIELTPKQEANYDSPFPGDYAILAMSHFNLDEIEKAGEYRRNFNEAMKQDAFKDDEECNSFAAEVGEMFFENAKQ